MPEVVDRHRAQRARDALARRQEHVHLARVGVRRRSRTRRRSSRSVSLPRARQHGDDVACPARASRRCASAARLRRSASATEVPPNFMTTVSGMRPAGYDQRQAPRGARRLLVVAGRAHGGRRRSCCSSSAPGRDEEPAPGRGVPEAGSRFGGDGAQTGRTDAERPQPRRSIERRGRPALRRRASRRGRAPAARVGRACSSATRTTRSPAQLRALTGAIEPRARGARGGPPPLVVADPARARRASARVDQPTLGAEGTPADARETARRRAGACASAGVDVVLAPVGRPRRRRRPGRAALVRRRPAAGRRRSSPQAVDGWRDGRRGRRSPAASPARAPRRRTRSRARRPSGCRSRSSSRATCGRSPASSRGRPAMQMSAALYAAWDGVTPATLLPEAVQLLRERLGFRGAIVSADLVAATAATGEGVGAGGRRRAEGRLRPAARPGRPARSRTTRCAPWSARCGAATSPPSGSTRRCRPGRRAQAGAAGRT